MQATDLDRIVIAALAEFAQCDDPASLENAKARYLGKTGALTEQLKGLAKLSPVERPAAGATPRPRKYSPVTYSALPLMACPRMARL